MNRNNRQYLVAIALVELALMSESSVAEAGNLPREGTFDFNWCAAGEVRHVAVSDQLAIGAARADAAIYSNPRGGPFDLSGSHCEAVYHLDAGTWRVNGYCVQQDSDADKWVIKFNDVNFAGSFETIGGTGKYAGMVATGEFKPIGIPPAVMPGVFQRCNRFTGSYRLK